MFVVFFLVISTFWILKPLKTALFLRYYNQTGIDLFGSHFSAAQAEQIAKLANMGAALFVAIIFGLAARWCRRQHLVYFWTAILIPCFLWFGPALAVPDETSVWSFYVFGDLYNSVMVAAFFAFLNDSVNADGAKRLYGPVILGGVAGGAVGTLVVQQFIRDLSFTHWMWICVAASVGVAAAAGGAGALRRYLPSSLAVTPRPAATVEPKLAAGFSLVLRSKYLLSIAAIVTLYELASAIMDYQFKAAATHLLDGEELGAYLSQVYFMTNAVVAVGVQLFLSSQIMTRFGVGAALLVLPVMALGGSAAFIAAPALLTAGALSVVDKGLSYSIQQSAKESLYVPTDWNEKYQAKAVIDVFLLRTVRGLAVLLGLGLSIVFSGFENLRWLSLATILIIAVWIPTAMYAGREFKIRAARNAKLRAELEQEAA